jgi:hypothetical protein
MEQEAKRQELMQALGGLGPEQQQEMQEMLFSGQFNPAEISSLRSLLMPQEADVKENVVFNPVTGEALLKQQQGGRVTGFTPIQGQMPQGMQQEQQVQPRAYETPVEAKERRAEERDYLKELRNDVKATNESSTALMNIENSLNKITTGIFSDARKALGSGTRLLTGSEFGTGASDLAKIDAASVKLLQPFISATKGAISDKEMAIFQSAVPNSNQLPETNKQIIEGMRLSIERKKEKLKAAVEWQKKGGAINEFEAEWAEYVNDNPVIEASGEGEIVLNKNNVGKFGKQSPSKSPASSNSIENLSDQELQALIGGGQ